LDISTLAGGSATLSRNFRHQSPSITAPHSTRKRIYEIKYLTLIFYWIYNLNMSVALPRDWSPRSVHITFMVSVLYGKIPVATRNCIPTVLPLPVTPLSVTDHCKQ
jgi:hypothetical protein